MPVECPNVLLVDDDPAMLRQLSGWLEAAGYQVRSVRDGRAALAAMEAQCPQFLVTDWAPPLVSGMEICRWVRSWSLPNYVYTVALTSESRSDELVRGLEAGADEFLAKPVQREELLARLRAGGRVLELENRLNRLAQRDSLTGLLTQRAFYELMRKEWARSRRYHIPLACVMVDIDFFKRINDTYGHSVGDDVIRRVATVLEENTRDSDAVGRYGGEEFCVLLPEIDEAQALAWADRVRNALSREPIRAGEKRIHITASFGVAQRHSDTGAPEELVDMADQALLVAKRLGRDQVVSYQTMNDSTNIQAEQGQNCAFAGLLARDVMTTIVAGLPQHEKVGRAVEYFLQMRINSAPVVDRDGRLVGVLSEKDAMTILLLPRWWETTIADVMKRGIITYDEETPAQVVYEFLCRVAIRSVVVVKEGRPTGILSRSSLLRWFINALIAKGEGGGLAGVAELSDEPQDLEEQLVALAGKLTEQAQSLEHDLAGGADDLKPRLVGGVSRMQELLNDLLAYSRAVPDGVGGGRDAERRIGATVSGLNSLLEQVGLEA
jgi:two-component system, cell cycle response regulator